MLAPPELRERIVRDAGDLRLVAHSDEVTGLSAAPAGAGLAAALAARAGPWQSDGFPRPLAARRRAAVWWPPAAAAAVLVLLVVIGLSAVRPAQRPVVADVAAPPGTEQVLGAPSEQVAAVPTTTAAATATTAATTTPAPTTTPGVLPPADDTTTAPTMTTPPTTTAPSTRTTAVPPTRPPTRTPTPPPTTTPAPVPTVAVDSVFGGAECGNRVWSARLIATVAGGRAQSVTATWTVGGTPTTVPMTATAAGSWVATAAGLTPGVDIPWSATATIGTRVISATATLRHNCPAG